MTIKEAIQRMIAQELKVQVVPGKVISVDETKMVCDIDLANAPDMLDVRIRAVIDEVSKGILIVPKVGSYVLVALIDNRKESSFICAYSELEKYWLLTDDIQLGGDNFKGLVKIEDLVSKLNNLENAFNQLVNEFNSHTHNAPQAPAGTIPTLPPLIPSTQSLVVTQVTDLENDKVKHGG